MLLSLTDSVACANALDVCERQYFLFSISFLVCEVREGKRPRQAPLPSRREHQVALKPRPGMTREQRSNRFGTLWTGAKMGMRSGERTVKVLFKDLAFLGVMLDGGPLL